MLKKYIKNTIKLLGMVGVASLLVFSKYNNAEAATVAGTVAQSTVSNLSLTLGTGAKVSRITLTSSGTTVGIGSFYDTKNVGLTNLFGSYSTIVSYATNYITTYTNYYGYTNNLTNVYLVDVTNTVAAVTNTIAPLLVLTASTNSTLILNNLGIIFQNGITISNATTPGSGTIQYSIDYTQ